MSHGGVARVLCDVLLFLALFRTASSAHFNRKSFPCNFTFGVGSAAYQYEGAAFEDGKGWSIWDNFTHTYPDKIADRSNGDVADDFYHRYPGDIKRLKFLNVDSFRFSISWPRILPNGSLSGGINHLGIAHYNKFIDALLANGIEPFVTIYHWDLPQALEDKYHGILSEEFVKDFTDFANICFNAFGDRVKHWVTFNEPWTTSIYGYASGALAPGRCSPPSCRAGDSATEPYTVTHHQLLAHASAVKLYREKYQAKQKGEIGITLIIFWYLPNTNTVADFEAANRSVEFMFDWFLHPIVYGDYPAGMKAWLGNRLPSFTRKQSENLKGSFDFVGINYYTTYYASSTPPPNTPNALTDPRANSSGYRNGVPIGLPDATGIFYLYPAGLREVLLYIKNRYGNPKVFITENGTGEGPFNKSEISQQLNDTARIIFIKKHLSYLHLAIKDGCNVKGYFFWTFLDDWEWTGGFTSTFGFYLVDRENLKRYPKKSAFYYSKFLKK